MHARNDAEAEWKPILGGGFVHHRSNLASLTVGGMNRTARWEACDSNEIPFTAASDLSLSPNGESRRKRRRRRDGEKEEAWKEGQSVAHVASIVK